jgi:ATP-dependent DNA ligase
MKFMQIEPAVARGKEHDGIWDDQLWVVEEKYDGDRRIAQFCGPLVRFTGRRRSVKDGLFVEKTANVPHLSDGAPRKLEGTVLDGEMIFTGETDSGGKSKYVTSIMGSLPEEAVAKQTEKGWLTYVVFDCLYYQGKDMRELPLEVRQEYADRAIRLWNNSHVMAAEQRHTDKLKFCKQIMARGGEGVVLKHRMAPYGDKQAWVKVKGQWTADVIITGYKDAREISRKSDGTKSETKFSKSGVIGAVEVSQYDKKTKQLVVVATISGMTDEERNEFTRHGDKYRGVVVRLEHNGREPTGRFRHPRFETPITFRSDKTQRDCVIDMEEK